MLKPSVTSHSLFDWPQTACRCLAGETSQNHSQHDLTTVQTGSSHMLFFIIIIYRNEHNLMLVMYWYTFFWCPVELVCEL